MPIFLSGFVVYGIVAAATGAGTRRGSRDDGPLVALAHPVPNANADSGSRLKAQYRLGDDGSKDYQMVMTPWIVPNSGLYAHSTNSYYDTLRQEQCAFAPAGDGVLRCVPLDYVQDGQPIYHDAMCAQRMVAIAAPSGGCMLIVPKYVVTLDYNSTLCPLTTTYYPAHYFPIQQFLGPNLSQCYTLNSSNVCVATGCPSGNGSGYAYYAVAAEVPATSFVGSTPQIDP